MAMLFSWVALRPRSSSHTHAHWAYTSAQLARGQNTLTISQKNMPSVLWRCWLGGRKGIRPVKTEWWGAGVVIGLERGADLHMAQLMPLPLTVSCFSKIQIGFTFLAPAHLGSTGKGPLNRCLFCLFVTFHSSQQPPHQLRDLTD